VHADDLRYRNDKEQCDALLEERDVKRVNEALAEHEADGPTGLRRRLLSTSVRLSRKMAPDIYALSDECVERLSMDIPLELYVYASPQFNAMCFKPEEGRLFVMFSSSLLENFTPKELQFVMGHEFGHHVYNHHAIPIGYIVKGRKRPDPKLALRLFAWSRNAEISADRAGADWFSTHPFSPLRVKALRLFFESNLMLESGSSLDELDVGVQRLMSMMEPSYLDAKTDAAIAMRHLLFAGSIVVANAAGGVSDKEIEAFEKL